MIDKLIILLLLLDLTTDSYGEEIMLPDKSTTLSRAPDESGMLSGLKYGVGWFCVVPMGIRVSSASRPESKVDLIMWTVRRNAYWFAVRRTAKAQDYVWFGDGYRRILFMQKMPSDVRGTVGIEPESHAVEGLPKLSGALLPLHKEHEYAELWGGCAFVRDIRPVDGNENDLRAEIALLDSLVHPIHFDRPPDRIVDIRKGDIIEVPAKVGKGRATAKIRCAGTYREMPDKGFCGGVDLVPIDWTFIDEAR